MLKFLSINLCVKQNKITIYEYIITIKLKIRILNLLN